MQPIWVSESGADGMYDGDTLQFDVTCYNHGMYKNKKWLHQQYVEKERSLHDIARECKTCAATVRQWVIQHGFKTRGLNESQTGSSNGSWVDSPIKNKEVFYSDYVTENLSLRRIAEKYGVSLRTAARWRAIHKIERKPKSQYRRLKGKSHPCYTHGRGGKASNCEECGKPITTKSIVCVQCKSIRYRGENNWNYKGIAEVMVLVRGWVATHWRGKVYRRDNYQCKKCGDSRGGNLQAHHKRHLSDIVKAITHRNGLSFETPEKRLQAVDTITKSRLVRSVSNGITLCKKCHKEEHRTSV